MYKHILGTIRLRTAHPHYAPLNRHRRTQLHTPPPKQVLETRMHVSSRRIFYLGVLPVAVAGLYILCGSDEPYKQDDSVLVHVLRQLPFRLMSRAWGFVNNDLVVPEPLRPLVYKSYATLFNCNLDEMQNKDLRSYKNLGQFFNRALDLDTYRRVPANIPGTEIVSCPADGFLLDAGKVHPKHPLPIKGVGYSVKSLIRSEPAVDLYYAVVYLSPGDYHRFHSPTNWTVRERKHIHGELLSVNPKFIDLVPDLFTLNERVALLGTWNPAGSPAFFAMVPVGATNVGSIHLNFDPELRTNVARLVSDRVDSFSYTGGVPMHLGAEMGGFLLGSTVVLLLEVPDSCSLTWCNKLAQSIDLKSPVAVNVNEPLAYIKPRT